MHWSDETPCECALCLREFSDDDDISRVWGDYLCGRCAEKYLPDAMDAIAAHFGGLRHEF